MTSADLPHDGRGGYLYYSNNISVPTYTNVTLYTNYATIDSYLFSGAGTATTYAVAFSACLMTLVHVIAFTTPEKRGRIVFNCIVAGLSFQIVRQFCNIWAVTRSATITSYFLLTLPADDATESEAAAANAANAYTNLGAKTRVPNVIDGATAVFSFWCIQVCFYVLVRTMMSAMPRKTTHIVTLSLAGLGIHAAIWGVVQFIWNAATVATHTDTFGPPYWMQYTTEAAYAASNCAWCLVYGCLVFRSALTRHRLGIEFKRGEARHVMFMTALQLMPLPIVFSILEWVTPPWFPEPAACIIPSILIQLPFGTVWATSFDPNEAHRGHVGRYQPNDTENGAARGTDPFASSAPSADSGMQPLVDQRAKKPSGPSTVPDKPAPDAINPAPLAPNNPPAHSFDDQYSDRDSTDTVRIQRQYPGLDEPVPQPPITRSERIRARLRGEDSNKKGESRVKNPWAQHCSDSIFPNAFHHPDF